MATLIVNLIVAAFSTFVFVISGFPGFYMLNVLLLLYSFGENPSEDLEDADLS